MPDVLAPLLTRLAASPVLFAAALVLAVIALAQVRVIGWISNRPALMLALGAVAGIALRMSGLPEASPLMVREAARLGLALLAFTAAQQCRLSRTPRVSRSALRLSLIAAPGLIVVTTVAVYALLPDLGLWSALLVGVALPLGAGAFDERLALGAPLSPATKRAVRIDAALGLALGVPLAILIEAASVAPPPRAALTDLAAYALFAGAAMGGTIGLLMGRLMPIREGGVPVAPFLAFSVAYATAYVLGFDAVMAGVACGLLYAEEAPLAGPVRSRLFSAGVRWCAGPAFFALGALMAPVAVDADLLLWLAAIVPVLALRAVLRGTALDRSDLPTPDRAFLAWFGGGPGAGAALFTLSLLASPSSAAQPGVLTVAALATATGLIAARLGSGPLVTRQVRAAARARRKSYGAA